MIEKILLVAQREWFENARTKAFWIGLLVLPVILVLAMVAPALLAKTKDARSYAVLDASAWLDEAVMDRAFANDLAIMLNRLGFEGKPWPESLKRLASLQKASADADDRQTYAQRVTGIEPATDETAGDVDAARPAVLELRAWWNELPADDARALDRNLSKARYERIATPASRSELNALLADDQLFAYIAIEVDPAESDEPSTYVSKNLTDTELEDWYSRFATAAIRDRRMTLRQIEPELASYLQAEFELERSKLSEDGEAESVSVNDRLRQWAPVGFVYLLWISIFTVSQMLLSNTIEEKSNKLMEVLLSSISPLQLMLGKILGIAATGLTMVGTWMIFLLGAAIAIPLIFGGGGGVDLSFLISEPGYVISFVVYFVLGYLLYAAILVAIGSVCSTIKEAQNLQTPLVMLLMIPLLIMVPIGQDPNGTLAIALSYFPPTTPFVMMNRAAGEIAWWEYVLTTIVLAGAVFLATVAAAKIFRIGVLMSGKPPSIKELWLWVRAPVGLIPVRKEAAADPDQAN